MQDSTDYKSSINIGDVTTAHSIKVTNRNAYGTNLPGAATQPGTTVTVFENNRVIGSTDVDKDGYWAFDVGYLSSGAHHLQDSSDYCSFSGHRCPWHVD